MRNWRNNKRIFITLWKLLEAALTVIQLAKMIYESPFGEWIRKVLTFLNESPFGEWIRKVLTFLT